MISNQVLQKTIEGIANISKIGLAIMDPEGSVLATSFREAASYSKQAADFGASSAESQVAMGCQFFKIFEEQQTEYLIVARGEGETTTIVGKMCAFQIEELMVAYKERFDRDNFIKNLLLDNLLLVDIYNRAKKLHIDTAAKRVVLIVEIGQYKEGDELERIRSLFGGKSRDFVTAVDEGNIIVVKELDEGGTYEEVE